MRRAARTDANQAAIVNRLIAEGWSVQSLATIGDGCPDLLVGAAGCNVLLEIKDGDKPPSRRKLTPRQDIWHGRWEGQVATPETPDEAVACVLEEIARRWIGQEGKRHSDVQETPEGEGLLVHDVHQGVPHMRENHHMERAQMGGQARGLARLL